jgi:hypothetical protein
VSQSQAASLKHEASGDIPSYFSSSNSSNGSSLPSPSKPSSILDVIREHTGRTSWGKAGQVENVSAPKLDLTKGRPGSSTIAWKHRQNRRILEKPSKRGRKVDNAVEKLYASEMMDAIEWSAAEA